MAGAPWQLSLQCAGSQEETFYSMSPCCSLGTTVWGWVALPHFVLQGALRVNELPPRVPHTAFYLSGLQLPLILVTFILQLFHFDFEVLELLQ